MPTTVAEIVVTGQRRKSPSVGFPPMPEPVALGGNGLEEQNASIGFEPETIEACDIPDFRDKWDADAAAAGAVDDFLNQASLLSGADAPNGNPTLGNREFGATLLLDNGVFHIGPVAYGPAGGGSVIMDTTGATPANYRGDIHTHPSGDGRPSSGDWASFRTTLQNVASAGLPTDRIYMYIVAYQPGLTPPYKIYVYDQTDDPQNGGQDGLGDEVNPNGTACPA